MHMHAQRNYHPLGDGLISRSSVVQVHVCVCCVCMSVCVCVGGKMDRRVSRMCMRLHGFIASFRIDHPVKDANYRHIMHAHVHVYHIRSSSERFGNRIAF